MPTFRQDLKSMVKEYKKAARSTRSLASTAPEDPDLDFYSKLGKDEFDTIALKFGLTEAVNLVEQMEAKKMGVK